jgi:hypothetical protein
MSCLSFASERARLGGVICSEKWRVNRFDYHAGTLSNYGSAFRVQVTAYLTDYCSFAYSALASFRMGMSGSASFQRVRKS